MEINTLIIGYVPITDTTGKKPRELRDHNYFKELLSSYDLGTIHHSNQTPANWQAKIDEVNPLIILYLGGEYYAQEVKKYKGDALMYLADDAGSVFYRKAEIEEKKEKHKKIFTEIESIVKKIRNDGEKEVEGIRKFSAMSYNDMYKMLQKAISSDDEDLRKKAWDLLFGEGEKHKDFIWMRVQMMAEVWEHSKGKRLEELMLMSMERHIDQGTARKMDNFTDEDGLEYYQYMFLDPLGGDANHIRRLPFATKEQDRYAYENLLEKNEIPTNYLRVQVEANSVRKHWDDYLTSESAKVKKVLEEWKKDSSKSKKELGVVPWNEGDSVDDPLTERELSSMKRFLKKHSQDHYLELFPE
jgi:hypothetical protein